MRQSVQSLPSPKHQVAHVFPPTLDKLIDGGHLGGLSEKKPLLGKNPTICGRGKGCYFPCSAKLNIRDSVASSHRQSTSSTAIASSLPKRC